MNHYKHLTLIERERIMFFLAKGYSITKIAQELGRNKSSISREIKRNKAKNEYLPVTAQNNYEKRRLKCKQNKKLNDPKIFAIIKDLFLNRQWSPEQIANRLSLEYGAKVISYNTIYREIYEGRFDDPNISRGNRGAIRKLRHRGKTRHTKNHEERRGKIPISHHLIERPNEANERSRIGDWEADTVLGTPGKAALVTLDDRKSRFLKATLIVKKTAINVRDAMIISLNNEPCYTITPDRGKEFSKHAEVTEKLDVEFYFPLPHQPWQRGTNENTNGLLREYFPKGFDLSETNDAYLQAVVDKLNKRPRKCLGWKTPYEVYYDKVLHLV